MQKLGGGTEGSDLQDTRVYEVFFHKFLIRLYIFNDKFTVAAPFLPWFYYQLLNTTDIFFMVKKKKNPDTFVRYLWTLGELFPLIGLPRGY